MVEYDQDSHCDEPKVVPNLVKHTERLSSNQTDESTRRGKEGGARKEAQGRRHNCNENDIAWLSLNLHGRSTKF